MYFIIVVSDVKYTHLNSATGKQIFMELDIGELHRHLGTVRSTQPAKCIVMFLGYLCYGVKLNVHTCFDPQGIIIRELNESQCWLTLEKITTLYRGAEKSLARPTSRCILFDGENISFDASLFICITSTNIPPIMIINRIYENQNLLSP